MRAALVVGLKAQLQSRSERGFFRRLILEALKETGGVGDDHELLVSLYRLLLLDREDLLELQSPLWWKRLAASLRLEALESDDFITTYERLLQDPHESVALSAMRALSRLQRGEKIQKVLEVLARRAPQRLDIYLEVLTRLGQHRGEELLQLLESCYDPEVASVIIYTLGEIRFDPSFEKLVMLTKSSSDTVVARSVEALAKLGRREALPIFHDLLHHPSEEVRVKVLEGMSRWGEMPSQGVLVHLSGEDSIDVRRAIFDLLNRGALQE